MSRSSIVAFDRTAANYLDSVEKSIFIALIPWIVAVALYAAFMGSAIWGKRLKRKANLDKFDVRRATKMPPQYVKTERNKFSDLIEGDVAYISFTDVAVDEKGATFVNYAAKIDEEPGFSTVKIRMEKDGCTLLLCKTRRVPLTFTPRELSAYNDYMPVLQIIEEE